MAEKYTDEIIKLEWEMFDKVNNEGGRASCQDDYRTFYIMRSSQFNAWNDAMRESYYNDLNNALDSNRNLLTEKYAYMTGYKYMGEMEDVETKKELLEFIMTKMNSDTEKMRQLYPKLARASRPYGNEAGSMVSVDMYLMCELMTYSVKTLALFWAYLQQLEAVNKSLPIMILKNTMNMMGYDSLEEAESRY